LRTLSASHFAHNGVPRPRLAITCGEPAGIGPEIALKAALQLQGTADCLLVGDAAQLRSLAAQASMAVDLLVVPAFALWPAAQQVKTQIAVVDSPLAVPACAGKLDVRNAMAVIQSLDLAIAAALAGEIDGIVTGPVQKSMINAAGLAFSGHTEYLAEKTGTSQVVMMLVGGGLRVALATTHLALKEVAAAIEFDSLTRTIAILHHDLQTRFGLARPRILVTGLNPHAGEGGYLGREEIEVITPVLEAAQARGWQVSGPYPADTLFQPKYHNEADCVLAMYHDQGLPVLKHASFGQGVNITLGLPVIRTSVDHGTALDLAAKGPGHADCSSMLEAVRLACQMAVSSRAAGSTATDEPT